MYNKVDYILTELQKHFPKEMSQMYNSNQLQFEDVFYKARQIQIDATEIINKSEKEYLITDEDFESECGGEFDDYVIRKKRNRKAFVNGALWMQKILNK